GKLCRHLPRDAPGPSWLTSALNGLSSRCEAMLFCSWNFALFLAVVLAVYWLIPWHRVQLTIPLPGRLVVTGHDVRVWWLVGASFYFYASWNRLLALLIFGTTVMDYLIALGMSATSSRRLRRALLLLSLTANLGFLVYFKYANFFLASLQDALRAAGMS